MPFKNRHFNFPKRLYRRPDAANYLAMSPGTFDKLVKEKRIPPAKLVSDSIHSWDVADLDAFVDDLPGRNEIDTSWDALDAA